MTDDDRVEVWRLHARIDATLDELADAADDTRELAEWDDVWEALDALKRFGDTGGPDPTRVALVQAWWAEADEREARARNPEVCGMIERATEEAVVRTLRRCAVVLRGGQ